MNHLHHRFFLTSLGLFVATTSLIAFPVSAAVTEPNGKVVPDLAPLWKYPDYSETTLQAYFDGAGEAIDAVSDANKEPGKFSPLCSFTAELVLSVGGVAGIAWYNVDSTDASAAPSAIYQLLAPSNAASQTIQATDISTDTNFVGPYIGFALTKDRDGSATTAPTAIYYSEYTRNAYCADCTTPGNWVAALAYRSTLRSDTYYLAFEDWEGASTTAVSWENDGDFNDKVFKLIGISCAGGGLECDTGGVGLCGVGVSECASDGGAPTCTPIYTARDEVCDDIDNDCDGETDDGELCPTDQSCVHGSCVFDCGGGEFICPDGYSCGTDGYCIETACVDVACEAGLACRNGECTSPCSGIVCPLNQTCVDGVCKDLCTGKVCGTGSVCDPALGACVGTCGCTACDAESGKVCDETSGFCVEEACVGVACEAGFFCVAGACVDACTGAVCPGGATCTDGSCAAPATTDPDGTSGAGAGGATGSGIVVGSSGTGTGDGTAGDASSGDNGSSSIGGDESGCGCRVASGRTSATLLGGILLGLGFLLGRRRR